MKKIIILSFVILILQGCSKEYENITVSYRITGLAKPYIVAYINENGETIQKEVKPENNKVWNYTFTARQGDMVYLYARFNDIGVERNDFYFRILTDNKIFRDAYGYDKKISDSTFWVRRSGVIPY